MPESDCVHQMAPTHARCDLCGITKKELAEKGQPPFPLKAFIRKTEELEAKIQYSRWNRALKE